MSPVESMSRILSMAQKDPVFQKILEELRVPSKTHINVTGMTDSHKAYLISAVCRETGQKPVILVPDELRARMLQMDLSAFIEEDVLILRQRELNLADVDASSREAELSRIGVLSRLLRGDFGAVVITAGALMNRLMPVSDFRKTQVNLRVGMRVSPEDLAMRLVNIGYERQRKVEGEGGFARRGDIFDVFPAGSDEPVRISFFDEDIDQIKTFDLETQRSTAQLKEIFIPLGRELLVPENKRGEISRRILDEGEKARLTAAQNGSNRDICEGLSRLALQDADRISEGLQFSGLEKWTPILLPQSASVLSYIRSCPYLLFLDEALSFRKRLDSAQADFVQRFAALLEKGQVLPLSEGAIWKGSEIFIELDQKGRVITLSGLPTSGNGLPSALSVTIPGRASESFRGHEENLAKLITQRRKDAKDTIIMAGEGARADRLRQFLADNDTFSEIFPRHLPAGFEYPAAGLLVIGTQDVFGVDRPMRRKKSSGVHIDLFSDLTPGELVVHEQHGIGRYDGMVNLETSGARRDYLKITYASDDSLYIAMEKLDQIQKYVGSEGRTPKLSRLGGQEWNRMKEKARTSIRKLAVDLVELYAQRQEVKGHVFPPDTVCQREFEEDFPFQETEDQLSAIADIKSDMESEKVMDRLLCGDVGFGKTEVAFRAIFKCIMDGKQAILLAPTTVLVQQHYENLRERLSRFPVKVGLLSRFATPAMIKQTVQGLHEGSVDVVVGTHRVLSKDILPKDIGLLVVDEEQRFGVEHKERLKALRHSVDVLTLTATPIPRTLHMSLSGIRDISILEEPPLDRRPVQTYVMEYDEDITNEACLREISRQGQVFYLFNDTHRITEKVAALEKALPGARITYAHGKMGERQLENIIESFIYHEADILVCTTIIESGIDMPNVNTIIVEDADRFGLAQLYQLKGRVGRSDRQAYAYITYRRDKVLTEVAEKRLTAIRDFTELGSGFKIALKDLEVRGAGNLLGAEQHGQMDVIGYDLYCRMLEEEINNVRSAAEIIGVGSAADGASAGGVASTGGADAGSSHGLSGEGTRQAVVEMDVDAYISPEYISDDGQRMDAYRRISDIRSSKEYMDVQDELMDRYGEVPRQVQILTDISYIRHMAGRFGFNRVLVKEDQVLLYYVENARPDMEALSRILAHPDFKGRIMFSAMQKPYIQYRPAPKDRGQITDRLREFFRILEGAESNSTDENTVNGGANDTANGSTADASTAKE